MKACFFAKVDDPRVLTRNEFYSVDLKILDDLGFDVTISTKPWNIPKADLYVVWWWTWAVFPLLRAKLRGVPVIIVGTFDHVMSDGTLEYFPRRKRWHQTMIRYALKAADANVVVSRDQFGYMERHFVVNNLEYSPHVINTDVYVPTRRERSKYFVTFCWMNTGNAKRKCIFETIEAMSRLCQELSEYKLLICGERGTDYEALQSLVTSLGVDDSVEFPGVVSVERKIELMQSCAVYLQPTTAEGFGVAILEAMSCGAPIVTSPVGAVPEVAGDTVLMVDGTNPNAIATAVKHLVHNKAIAEDYGVRARSRAVELFSYERRKADIARIIQVVLKNYETGTPKLPRQ
jgi:glycosyltransferase involved in cell wall biosynthesis